MCPATTSQAQTSQGVDGVVRDYETGLARSIVDLNPVGSAVAARYIRDRVPADQDVLACICGSGVADVDTLRRGEALNLADVVGPDPNIVRTVFGVDALHLRSRRQT